MIDDKTLDKWKNHATRKPGYIVDSIEIDPLGHDYKDQRIVELIQALRKEREDKKVLMEALRRLERAKFEYVIRDDGPFKNGYEGYTKGTRFAFNFCEQIARAALEKVKGH